jgi:hypothetical protein
MSVEIPKKPDYIQKFTSFVTQNRISDDVKTLLEYFENRNDIDANYDNYIIEGYLYSKYRKVKFAVHFYEEGLIEFRRYSGDGFTFNKLFIDSKAIIMNQQARHILQKPSREIKIKNYNYMKLLYDTLLSDKYDISIEGFESIANLSEFSCNTEHLFELLPKMLQLIMPVKPGDGRALVLCYIVERLSSHSAGSFTRDIVARILTFAAQIKCCESQRLIIKMFTNLKKDHAEIASSTVSETWNLDNRRVLAAYNQFIVA